MDKEWNKSARMLRGLEAARREFHQHVEYAEEKFAIEAKESQAMGRYWAGAREERKLKVWELGDRLEIPDAELGGYEMGLEPSIWRGPFPIRYAAALESLELYPQFCERFNIPPYEAPRASA